MRWFIFGARMWESKFHIFTKLRFQVGTFVYIMFCLKKRRGGAQRFRCLLFFTFGGCELRLATSRSHEGGGAITR